jgi:hypothetical protein
MLCHRTWALMPQLLSTTGLGFPVFVACNVLFTDKAFQETWMVKTTCYHTELVKNKYFVGKLARSLCCTQRNYFSLKYVKYIILQLQYFPRHRNMKNILCWRFQEHAMLILVIFIILRRYTSSSRRALKFYILVTCCRRLITFALFTFLACDWLTWLLLPLLSIPVNIGRIAYKIHLHWT